MKLHVTELKKGGGDFIACAGSIELQHARLDTWNEDAVLLHVNLQAAYVQSSVLLKGTWWAEMDTVCHRCLAPIKLRFSETIYEEFAHQARGTEHGAQAAEELEQRAGEHFAFRGETLDLEDYFKQLFLLSQPLKVLCRDDCRGLCSNCGAHKNTEICSCEETGIDPRWLILDSFKEET